MSKELAEKGLQAREEHREYLSTVKQVMDVPNMAAARSKKVLDYVVTRLQDGARWDVIRRELGLNPANRDHKWREIRRIVSEMLLPVSEEEALLANNSDMMFWMSKLEGFLTELDERISEIDDVQVKFNKEKGAYELAESKNLSQFLKTKHDTIKTMLEYKNRFFKDYMSIKHLRSKEKQNQGVSIMIVNNIPRPGDTAEECKERVIKTVAKAPK